ncbi:MAG: hypothetical protein E6J73_18190 [Deltaproteobacteria bacterium]|nr:MAG: hypothetical protein E6J73_18190 [Deltaproteobacteria bacterium]
MLDNDPSTLRKTREILSSARWDLEPFVDPDTILNYAATHRTAAAIINFGGSCVHALDIAAHLRAISPSTPVIISLKVHRNKAHKMLIGTEMVNLIKQRCVEKPEPAAFKRPTFSRNFSQNEEFDLGYCA